MNPTTTGDSKAHHQLPDVDHESAAPLTWREWLRGNVAMMLTLAGLLGAALWGHHTGWALLPPSAPENAKNAAGDWCSAHGVPESLCIECNQGLLKGKAYGWCDEHGIAECPLCHPDVAQLASPVMPSSERRERFRQAIAVVDRPQNNPKCNLHVRRLQVPSAEAAAKVGIDVAPVLEGPMTEAIGANGEIAYDATRIARLSSRAPGSVWLVAKQIGDRVQQGELLAVVDAAEVGRAKSEFLQAHAQLNLKTKLWNSISKLPGVTAERTIQEAEAALREARIRWLSAQQALINLGFSVPAEDWKELPEEMLRERLRFIGLPPAVTRELDPRTTTTNLLPIKSPLDGIVTARDAVPGEGVDSGRILFTVADTRRMWLNLDVRVEDARYLKPGQVTRFIADSTRKEISAPITWISTATDEKTRTIRVRAEIENPDGKVRAGTFGAGRIILREEKNAVVVPKEALQWEGCCHVVFVRDTNFLKDGAPKVFHVRKVVPGAADGANVEILAGLVPGEVVVAKGSAMLRGELLKNDLRCNRTTAPLNAGAAQKVD